MQPWSVERGTFWALEPNQSLPTPYPANIEVGFKAAESSDLADLAQAMNLSNPEPLYQRLQNKRRRCFILRANGRLVTYGWVTKGAEHVGELERYFDLTNNEAYIWDCGTVPAWRGQHCYSALLSHLIYQLHDEGVPRIWIGASRQNKASVQGFINAGFNWVLDLSYRRYRRVSMLWFQTSTSAPSDLISAAYRVLLNQHERRFGPLAVGYKRQ